MTRVLPDPAPARISSGPLDVKDRFALLGVQGVEESTSGRGSRDCRAYDRSVVAQLVAVRVEQDQIASAAPGWPGVTTANTGVFGEEQRR